MKQKFQIALLCIGLVGLSLWVSWPKRVPSVDGKTVSEWLVELAPFTNGVVYGAMTNLEWAKAAKERRLREERGQSALRTIGEPAVPYVLALFEESPPRPQWMETAAKTVGWKLPVPPSREIRIQRATLAFAALGTNAQSALPKLRQMLSETNTMSDAAICLGNIGSSGVPLLLSGLTSSNQMLREVCISHIGRSGTNASAAVPVVLAAVADPNLRVARAAAFIYPGMEPDKHKLVATLLQWSRSNAVNVHSLIEAMKTVGYFRRPHGAEVQPLIAELIKMVDDAEPIVQAEAISALGAFSELAAAARPKIITALQSEAGTVRRSASGTLGAMRLEPETAVPLLIKLAQEDSDELVRSAALHAAATFGEAGFPFSGPLRAEVEKAYLEQTAWATLWNSVAPK